MPESEGCPQKGERTIVLEVAGVQWVSSKGLVEKVLARRAGVAAVSANPVAQTATVVYDPEMTSPRDLAAWIRKCGYHCEGASVPLHICDPLSDGQHDGIEARDTQVRRQLQRNGLSRGRTLRRPRRA